MSKVVLEGRKLARRFGNSTGATHEIDEDDHYREYCHYHYYHYYYYHHEQ